MKFLNWTTRILTVSIATLTFAGHAQSSLTVEGSMIWQSRNDQRVPGDSGTEFSISDFDTGPFAGYRIYAGHIRNKRHELRALYAPLTFEVDGSFDQTVDFQNATFAADTETTAFYKFNSYRLTYAYHFDQIGGWQLALGFTGKVRDAEVKLKQNGLERSKANVGFVPLLNFQARYAFSSDWLFRFDVDGLAAPQGRAIDAGLFIERGLAPFSVFAGYRTVEGGADNEKVYNFAWLHQAVIGARFDF
jgi:hypothetical protein